jgi:hypothetical protein
MKLNAISQMLISLRDRFEKQFIGPALQALKYNTQ